jgi:hypothetical protein
VIYGVVTGVINSASLFFGVFTRLLTGVATMWVSGYCFITAKAMGSPRDEGRGRASREVRRAIGGGGVMSGRLQTSELGERAAAEIKHSTIVFGWLPSVIAAAVLTISIRQWVVPARIVNQANRWLIRRDATHVAGHPENTE